MKTIEELKRQAKEDANRISKKKIVCAGWMLFFSIALLGMNVCFDLGIQPFDRKVLYILDIVVAAFVWLLGVYVLFDIPFLIHNHKMRAAMNEQHRRMMEQQRLVQQSRR